MHQIVTVGNALIDAFMTIEKNSRYARVDTANHELCFKYGQKIHVEQTNFLLGGNACNVGVGLSRLGLSTGFVAEIGDDDFSGKIMNLLDKESLDTSLVLQAKNAAASFAVGINLGGDRTLFIEHVHRDHNFDLTLIHTKWVYLTSLGEEWTHVYAQIIKQAKDGQFKLAFSPGTHQLDNPHEEVKDALFQADILFVNKEEAQLLIKYYMNEHSEDIPTLLKTLHEKGIPTVSITDGGKGSYAIDEKGEMYHLKTVETEIVERTGAGDGYAAGFMAAFLDEKEIPEAMRFGAMNAAAVIGKMGAETGLLTRETMNEQLMQHEAFQPEKLTNLSS